MAHDRRAHEALGWEGCARVSIIDEFAEEFAELPWGIFAEWQVARVGTWRTPTASARPEMT